MYRRHFLKAAAAGGAVSALRAAPSDRVRVAMMGVGGRGRALMAEFSKLADVEIATICEVDSNVAARALKGFAAKGGKTPPVISDIRRALDDKNVDALVIATPDHWHAPATILACEAGKDVYVEKPASHNAREGRWMVEAARRTGRVVQVGTQARSRPSTIEAIEYARSGKIGRVLMAKAWNVQLRENIGRRPDSPVPPGVDYETWTGPAKMLRFNENRFHYKWHWHWNYGTGDIGNDGVHQLDQARWALGVDLPTRVTGMGKKLYFDDDQQTPDTMNVTYEYADRVLVFEMRIWSSYPMEDADNAVNIYGTAGMVHTGRTNKVFDDKGKLVKEWKASPDQHARNFVDCVKSRNKPNADIEIGHFSTMLSHLGNIAARTGRTLRLAQSQEEILADTEATALLGREYRDHWSRPRTRTTFKKT